METQSNLKTPEISDEIIEINPEKECEPKEITSEIKKIALENVNILELPIDPADKNIPNLFFIPQSIRPLIDGEFKDQVDPETGKTVKVDTEQYKFSEILVTPFQDPEGPASMVMCIHKIMNIPITSIILISRCGELKFARFNPYRFKHSTPGDVKITEMFVEWIKRVVSKIK